ncbi:protocatechuate 3,4-dioxygenase, partial [Corallococcus terminator]
GGPPPFGDGGMGPPPGDGGFGGPPPGFDAGTP